MSSLEISYAIAIRSTSAESAAEEASRFRTNKQTSNFQMRDIAHIDSELVLVSTFLSEHSSLYDLMLG
jgi:hypothetical protein